MHLRNMLPQGMLKELAPALDQAEKEVATTGWKDWHYRTAMLPTSLAPPAPVVSGVVLETVH